MPFPKTSIALAGLPALKRALLARPVDATVSLRCFSTSIILQSEQSSSSRILQSEQSSTNESPSSPSSTKEPILIIREYLSNPSWSVKSLLPTPEQTAVQSPVSSQQLRHLLRLSALPPPKDAAEEAKMLETLASQLLFVQEIQKVDTAGVEPLRALRDESLESEKANEVTLASLKEALNQEEVVGKHHKRIRRKQDQINTADNPTGWKPLDHAERKVGKFFIVDSSTAPPE
ncbi:aspartyl/glutamyl-tRNA(Asn/Gln) amidotransferase C subunit [Venturia nashicola]|nr:aspartyl/glutamyl-tRNA(Asn/Gln) amidotransferase C subunit [Venturia nashicola]